MDRIIKNYVDSFWLQNGFDDKVEETKKFEHFVNNTLIEPRVEESFDIEELNIGNGDTIGIDGFALIINKQLFTDLDSLTDFLQSVAADSISVEICFIQAKTSSKFSIKEVGLFGDTVNDFISQNRRFVWSDVAKEKMKLFDLIFSFATKFKENPMCHLFYVSLGNYLGDQNQENSKRLIVEKLREENVFSDIHFEFIDTHNLQNKFKKLGQALTKSFEFENRILIPKINNAEESYLGIVKAKEIIKLITEDGNIISNVFYDNVRDFQGPTILVNKEIADTLSSPTKDAFVLLNNGITIVAEGSKDFRHTFTLTNYQIINGCQTSHVLFNCQSEIDDSVYVSLKLIISKDVELTSKLILSTNHQTAIKEQDLLAFTEFHRRLEDFYKTYNGNQQLFYERRNKQFRLHPIEKNRIIDKTTQIKVVGSFVFAKPSTSTRYLATLFNEIKEDIFKSNHQLIVYYTSAFAFYKIQDLLKRRVIDSRFAKFKYYILMMLRFEISIGKIQLDSKQAEIDCNNILNILNDEPTLIIHIESIIGKIDSIQGFDLNSLETSKLKSFADKCKSFYFPNRSQTQNDIEI